VGINDPAVQIDPAHLSSLVQVAFHNPRLQISDWQIQRLYGGYQFSNRLYRLQGHAVDASSSQKWSLVLKIIRPDAGSDDPGCYNYWKHEVLVYESGLLNDLNGPLLAPRCYDICDQPDGSLWLYLEDVRQEGDPSWSLEKYVLIARCLGEFNGAYLAGRPPPQAAWARRNWLRNYLEHAQPAFDFLRQNPHHPVVMDIFNPLTLVETLAFWEMHPRLLKLLDEMPQAFCHLDAFERNLFVHGEQVVAIDWAFAGIAPLGAELTPLIAAAPAMGNFPASRARELDKACFEAYLEGLCRAGFTPDPQQVRLGFTLTFGLRYILGNTVGETIPTLLDEKRREFVLQTFDRPEVEEGKSDPQVVAYYQAIFLEILRQLGLSFTLQLIMRTLGYLIRFRRRSKI
jgi:hypothetical protein